MGRWLFVVLVCVILFSGCAAGQNPNEGTTGDIAEKPAGFWLGLWHGLIVPVAFVISLFKPLVGIYEVHNTGATYNLGFVLGAAIIFGGGGGGSTTVVNRR